nr:Scr1 family TA system antitoxin-like transcriptional regulator [Streptomyces sp. NTH33]
MATRLARQRRLSDDRPLAFRAVIHEAEQPDITLLIHPFSAGPHVGPSSAFNVISFAEPKALDVVYLEIPFTRLWIEGGDGAAAHDKLFEARSCPA